MRGMQPRDSIFGRKKVASRPLAAVFLGLLLVVVRLETARGLGAVGRDRDAVASASGDEVTTSPPVDTPRITETSSEEQSTHSDEHRKQDDLLRHVTWEARICAGAVGLLYLILIVVLCCILCKRKPKSSSPQWKHHEMCSLYTEAQPKVQSTILQEYEAVQEPNQGRPHDLTGERAIVLMQRAIETLQGAERGQTSKHSPASGGSQLNALELAELGRYRGPDTPDALPYGTSPSGSMAQTTSGGRNVAGKQTESRTLTPFTQTALDADQVHGMCRRECELACPPDIIQSSSTPVQALEMAETPLHQMGFEGEDPADALCVSQTTSCARSPSVVQTASRKSASDVSVTRTSETKPLTVAIRGGDDEIREIATRESSSPQIDSAFHNPFFDASTPLGLSPKLAATPARPLSGSSTNDYNSTKGEGTCKGILDSRAEENYFQRSQKLSDGSSQNSCKEGTNGGGSPHEGGNRVQIYLREMEDGSICNEEMQHSAEGDTRAKVTLEPPPLTAKWGLDGDNCDYEENSEQHVQLNAAPLFTRRRAEEHAVCPPLGNEACMVGQGGPRPLGCKRKGEVFADPPPQHWLVESQEKSLRESLACDAVRLETAVEYSFPLDASNQEIVVADVDVLQHMPLQGSPPSTVAGVKEPSGSGSQGGSETCGNPWKENVEPATSMLASISSPVSKLEGSLTSRSSSSSSLGNFESFLETVHKGGVGNLLRGYAFPLDSPPSFSSEGTSQSRQRLLSRKYRRQDNDSHVRPIARPRSPGYSTQAPPKDLPAEVGNAAIESSRYAPGVMGGRGKVWKRDRQF